MEWLNDYIPIDATDAAAAYVERWYNVGLGRWEKVRSGTYMSPGMARMSEYRVRLVNIWPQTSAGVVKDGVMAQVVICANPLQTSQIYILHAAMSGNSPAISWEGDFPMCAGIGWRFNIGALVDTDKVSMIVGYEKDIRR